MKDSEKQRTETAGPFQRFEDLTKRLLAVPKQEAGKEWAKKSPKKRC